MLKLILMFFAPQETTTIDVTDLFPDWKTMTEFFFPLLALFVFIGVIALITRNVLSISIGFPVNQKQLLFTVILTLLGLILVALSKGWL